MHNVGTGAQALSLSTTDAGAMRRYTPVSGRASSVCLNPDLTVPVDLAYRGPAGSRGVR